MDYKFTELPDMIDPNIKATLADNQYPVANDTAQLFDIVHRYVSKSLENMGDVFSTQFDEPTREFVKILCQHLGIHQIETKEHLARVLAQLICNGTGYHEVQSLVNILFLTLSSWLVMLRIMFNHPTSLAVVLGQTKKSKANKTLHNCSYWFH